MMIKAKKSDLKEIMDIIATVVEEMKSYDNDQWDEKYPQSKDFEKDIEAGDLYIYTEDGNIIGFICVNYIEAEEYKNLNWSSDEKCMVIHRMAVNSKFRKRGIGSKLIKFAEELALKNGVKYLKTDTYSANIKMNLLFKKLDYKFVGEMSYQGKERPFYCYEKMLGEEK